MTIGARIHFEPVYWVSDSSQSEIDFIIQHDAELIPIEVKAETNLQAKSLKLFCRKFKSKKAVRLSLAHWSTQEMPIGDNEETCCLVNLPLFAAQQLTKAIEEAH